MVNSDTNHALWPLKIGPGHAMYGHEANVVTYSTDTVKWYKFTYIHNLQQIDLIRKQEKSNNDKRLRDAFSLMNDILTSKPSVDHKPSYKQANHDGTLYVPCMIFQCMYAYVGSTIYKRKLSKVRSHAHILYQYWQSKKTKVIAT